MTSTERPSATGGEPSPGERSADIATAGSGLAGFETRLLSELRMVVAERAAAAGQKAGRRTGRGMAGRAWPRPAMATGALSAALAAGLAVALTVTSTGGNHPAAPHFEAATTVAAVLNNAAAAALSEPTVEPRPGQFVYTGTRLEAYQPRRRGFAGYRVTESIESWRSVGGTHVGATVTSGPSIRTARSVESACVNGLVRPPLIVARQRCTARQFAAYRPWLPSTVAGMRTLLAKGTANQGNASQTMLEKGFYFLTTLDLTPAQQAAMYHALAEVPGLTVVKATNILGRAGVGIRSRPAPGMSWTAIFDATTFQPLGVDIEPTGRGYDRQAITVQATIVDRVGQRP